MVRSASALIRSIVSRCPPSFGDDAATPKNVTSHLGHRPMSFTHNQTRSPGAGMSALT